MEEANSTHPLFLDADKELRRVENLQYRRYDPALEQERALELDVTDEAHSHAQHLIVKGGEGGVGNPAFVTHVHRSPKFARRGLHGEHVKLSLELKLLADVGLVGLPNAGKSSILSALTNSKTKVANYAFTTLKPEIGVVENGGRKELSTMPTFTVLDNPGLIAEAAMNKGLGHTFLRSVERALVLVYVLDLSSESHLHDLDTLVHELNEYKAGLAKAGTVVVANKADLLGGSEEKNVEARERLQNLTAHVNSLISSRTLHPSTTVIPISAKHAANVSKLTQTLGDRVLRSKQQQQHEQQEIE